MHKAPVYVHFALGGLSWGQSRSLVVDKFVNFLEECAHYLFMYNFICSLRYMVLTTMLHYPTSVCCYIPGVSGSLLRLSELIQ